MKKLDNQVIKFVGLFLVIIIMIYMLPYIITLILDNGSSCELLQESTSPNGEYSVSAYRVNSGAMSDYAIEVFLESGNKKKKIYFAYHEYKVSLIWVSDEIICINDRSLDLSKGETYDSRK